MAKKNKNVSLESLAAGMQAGFKRLDGKMKVGFHRMDKGFKDAQEDNESLARMVANGFNHTQAQLNEVKSEINIIKSGIVEAKFEIKELNDGQEQILLRLDHTASRFEVVDLQRRVTHLERKSGLRR